jgi:hypothetical protein
VAWSDHLWAGSRQRVSRGMLDQWCIDGRGEEYGRRARRAYLWQKPMRETWVGGELRDLGLRDTGGPFGLGRAPCTSKDEVRMNPGVGSVAARRHRAVAAVPEREGPTTLMSRRFKKPNERTRRLRSETR